MLSVVRGQWYVVRCQLQVAGRSLQVARCSMAFLSCLPSAVCGRSSFLYSVYCTLSSRFFNFR